MKAILFDMDDTILHLDVDWKAVEREVREHSAGRGKGEPTELVDIVNSRDCGELREWVLGLMAEREAKGLQNVRPMPHANEVLSGFHRARRLGLVTGNGGATAKKALEKLGFAGYFDAIITRDFGLMKPRTEPVEAALRQLGCSADEAVFVGNSRSDMKVAKALGMLSIGITTTRTAEELKSHGADFIIKDLKELEGLIE